MSKHFLQFLYKGLVICPEFAAVLTAAGAGLPGVELRPLPATRN